MKSKLSILSRLLLVFSAIGLVFVLYTPIWRIDLDAPQYPEGLNLKIHASGLKGNVDIINGLNHYIGMKTLHSEDFIEFTLLPYLIIIFASAFLLVAILNRRKWLNTLFVLFVLFGVIAMADFWRWEYNYGHNLDPNAAIVVPGMAYQPPLIGFKQLLNFGAYSVPDTGGWIFIGAGLLLLICVMVEWKINRASSGKKSINPMAIALTGIIMLSSCSSGPDPIKVGQDNCYLCKMTIADEKYGAELISNKGKVYKFDDIECLRSFMQSGIIEKSKVREIYLVDYAGDHSLVNAKQCYLLQGESIKGPMNGHVIAFKEKESMQKMMSQLNAAAIQWEQFMP